MTILPKKKPTKDKNETETTDHSSMGHPHTSTDNRHDKSNRGRNSPTRWLPSTSRDELLTGQDPGGSYEGFDGSNGNKRRHRSSPHRSVRKHRLHNHQRSTTHTASSSAASNEYEETLTGQNSDDEYVPPKCPDNIDEVWNFTFTFNILVYCKVETLRLFLTSCFGLMADSAVVDSALVDAALRKSGLI